MKVTIAARSVIVIRERLRVVNIGSYFLSCVSTYICEVNEPGPEHYGYLIRIHVQDTDEYAKEVGKGYLVGNVGVGRLPMPPDYMFPVGYSGRDPKYLALGAAALGAQLPNPFLGNPNVPASLSTPATPSI